MTQAAAYASINLASELRAALPDPRECITPRIQKSGGEIAGPCPKCGGTDRFFIRSDDSFMCRQCGVRGGDRISFFQLSYQTDFMGLVRRFLNDSQPSGNASPKPTMKQVSRRLQKPLRARINPKNLKATFSYLDEQGQTLFQVRRFEEPGRQKVFCQGHVDADGKFVSSISGIRRVLYRLPEVVTAETVSYTHLRAHET